MPVRLILERGKKVDPRKKCVKVFLVVEEEERGCLLRSRGLRTEVLLHEKADVLAPVRLITLDLVTVSLVQGVPFVVDS